MPLSLHTELHIGVVLRDGPIRTLKRLEQQKLQLLRLLAQARDERVLGGATSVRAPSAYFLSPGSFRSHEKAVWDQHFAVSLHVVRYKRKARRMEHE